jgi:hypothetical protein
MSDNTTDYKVFVYVTKTWSTKAVFASLKDFDSDKKRFLSIFEHPFKIIHQAMKTTWCNNVGTFETVGFHFDKNFVPFNSIDKNFLSTISQWTFYCNSDLYDDLNNSFLWSVTNEAAQLSLYDLRKYFLSLTSLPDQPHTHITISDCVILNEIEYDDKPETKEKRLFQATVWWAQKNESQEVHENFEDHLKQLMIDAFKSNNKIQKVSISIADSSPTDGYGFIRLKSSEILTNAEVIINLNSMIPEFWFLVKSF